jgi:hypothetical protein
MPLQNHIYLAGLGLSVILSALLLRESNRSASKLPEAWRKTRSFKKFHLSVWFLMIYLFLNLVSELIATYLAFHHTYNNFIYSIGLTIYFPFFLSFLFLYTNKNWKKFAYFILYATLVGYFVWGGYYHPLCVISVKYYLIVNGVFFISCLFHLTDLLVSPTSDHFKFQLKINLIYLIFSLLANITSTHWKYENQNNIYSDFAFQLQFFFAVVLYYIISLILLLEIIKLRRKQLKNA